MDREVQVVAFVGEEGGYPSCLARGVVVSKLG